MMIKNRFKFFLFQVICQNGNTLIEKLATLITERKANLAHHIDSIRGKNMNISDLNHLEVVSEETNVEGGSYGYYYPSASASAGSDSSAVAYGFNTYTSTYTSTSAFAQGGYVSASGSSSGANASSSLSYYR
ncbi:MAG: hypothetical protein WAN66_05440 [Limnoraphis robusta]